MDFLREPTWTNPWKGDSKSLGNGVLIHRTEEYGLEFNERTNQSMRHQQKVIGRRLRVVVRVTSIRLWFHHQIVLIRDVINYVQAREERVVVVSIQASHD